MELEKLYDIAFKENISILDLKLNNKAIISCIKETYCIGLNSSLISNSSEEKTILAEELRSLLY